MDAPYYRTESRRLTLAERWRVSQSWTSAVLAVLTAPLRIRPQLLWGTAYPDRMERIDPDVIPRRAWLLWDEPLATCDRMGFIRRFAYTPPIVGDGESWGLALSDATGAVLIFHVYARIGRKENTAMGCVSRRRGGVILATTAERQKLNSAPGVEVVRMVGSPPEHVIERHRERVRSESPDILRLTTDDDIFALVVENARRTADNYIERGIWVALTEEEVARLRAKPPPPAVDPLDE